MKRDLGMSAKEKRIVELAALTIKAALDDLPNNPELCAGIVVSAEMRRRAMRRVNWRLIVQHPLLALRILRGAR